jgi:hypothetical protein
LPVTILAYVIYGFFSSAYSYHTLYQSGMLRKSGLDSIANILVDTPLVFFYAVQSFFVASLMHAWNYLKINKTDPYIQIQKNLT